MFTVHNLHDTGSQSVGTRPMTHRETVASVTARTGQGHTRVDAMLRLLDTDSSLDIPAAPDSPGTCAVRITNMEA